MCAGDAPPRCVPGVRSPCCCTDTRAVVEVLSPEGETVRALLYTANPSNPHFYLPAPEEAARIIATAVGPSGANVDYLLNLAAWLERNKLEDAHVEELRRLLPRQGDI